MPSSASRKLKKSVKPANTVKSNKSSGDSNSEIQEDSSMLDVAVQSEAVQLETAELEIQEDNSTSDIAVEPEAVEPEAVEPEAVELEIQEDNSMSDVAVELETAELEIKENNSMSDVLVEPETVQPETAELKMQVNEPVAQKELVDEPKQEIQVKTARTKRKIHLIDGEKGGVGKSLFARVILQYCFDRKYDKQFCFVESDLSNPDVGIIYFKRDENLPNYYEVEFTREEKKLSSADQVFELATERSVIVNLPSNIYSSVSGWLKQNNIFALAKENDIQICKWFVCNGGNSSLDKFKESVNEFHEDITHIFVRNKVIFEDWKIIDKDPKLQDVIKGKNILQMDFPPFSFEERNRVDAGQLTFSKALADDSGFGILSKQRIRNFLNDTYKGLDNLNLLP